MYRFSHICKTSLLLAVLASVSACASTASHSGQLPRFASQQEFDDLLEGWARLSQPSPVVPAPPPPPVESTEPPHTASADKVGAAGELHRVPVTGSKIENETEPSITNVQTEGVDEGGIVKRHGDYLLILRRGLLTSLHIGDDGLRKVSQINAYAPDMDGRDSWYDEMLISGDSVVVIGYSYQRKGTEVGLFQINAQGQLKYRETWHLASGDYYSSRNYASRLVGSTLVLYAPLPVELWGKPEVSYPGISRWRGAQIPQAFDRLLTAQQIYRADLGIEPMFDGITLHTVTRCRLDIQPMRCEASAVLSEAALEFYVSSDSVFLWVLRDKPEQDGRQAMSMVLRMPLDGSAATALKADGWPIDQMSFLQSDDGYLNVLVASQGNGQSMWNAEKHCCSVALLRTSLSSFGDATASAAPEDYRALPAISAYASWQNRFIGDWLVYSGSQWWSKQSDDDIPAYALRWAGAGAVSTLKVPHDIERIEAIGRDAVLIGNSKHALAFSSVALGADQASVHDQWQMPGVVQGERRTHGFFYRADGQQQGIIGLPIMREGVSGSRGFLGAPDGQSAITFLRNDALRWRALGELTAQPNVRDDQCVASCVDWYGNARPIFIGQRVFALMGYELIEGQIEGDVIRERRRLDFAPLVTDTSKQP